MGVSRERYEVTRITMELKRQQERVSWRMSRWYEGVKEVAFERESERSRKGEEREQDEDERLKGGGRLGNAGEGEMDRHKQGTLKRWARGTRSRYHIVRDLQVP